MEIECPHCDKTFNWEQPSDTGIFQMMSVDSDEETKSKRYVVKCPNCKKILNIRI